MATSSTLLQGTDLAQLQRAGGLYKLVLVIMLVYMGILLSSGQSVTPRLLAPVLITVFGAAAVWLQSRGQVRAAVLLFVWGIWGAVTAQGAVRNGVANAALFAYPALMLLGGWVLGLRQGMLLGAASIGASLLLALAEQAGWIPERNLDTAPVWYWFPICIVMLASMGAMRFILKIHWEALQKEHALNEELELVVATLTTRELALQKSEKRFHMISDSNPLPIAVNRLEDGRYLMVNPAWEREFGWSADEALGYSSVGIGFWESPTQREGLVQDLQREGRTLDRAIVAVARDGRRLNLILSSELIEYDGYPCVLATFVDQTERLRAEAEIKALNEKLETRVEQRTAELTAALKNLKKAQEELVQSEKMASLGQLVAGVAHELNTPIGNALITTTALGDATRAFDEVLKGGSLKRSTLDAYVQQSLEGTKLAERSLHRASDLVRSFKQVAVDQTSERRRSFDLAEVVHEVVDTLRPNLKGSKVQLQLDIPSGIGMESFPGPLGQIVINLVMNAVVHAFEGRDNGLITLRAVEQGDYVSLQCADNGCGVPEEHQSRIFDPFFTTKLGQGGSGLGLAIVYQMVTQVLGGTISVDSSTVEGTAFNLRLPLVAPNTEM